MKKQRLAVSGIMRRPHPYAPTSKHTVPRAVVEGRQPLPTAAVGWCCHMLPPSLYSSPGLTPPPSVHLAPPSPLPPSHISGYLVSQQQLRHRLMQIEWEGSLRLWAQRKGLAEFEQWLAEKGDKEGIQVDWQHLQASSRGRRGEEPEGVGVTPLPVGDGGGGGNNVGESASVKLCCEEETVSACSG